jgi:hypothetical protein
VKVYAALLFLTGLAAAVALVYASAVLLQPPRTRRSAVALAAIWLFALAVVALMGARPQFWGWLSYELESPAPPTTDTTATTSTDTVATGTVDTAAPGTVSWTPDTAATGTTGTMSTTDTVATATTGTMSTTE